MSAIRVVYVVCDGCGANDSADMADERATAGEQRRELHDQGWRTRPGGRDLCPDCLATPPETDTNNGVLDP